MRLRPSVLRPTAEPQSGSKRRTEALLLWRGVKVLMLWLNLFLAEAKRRKSQGNTKRRRLLRLKVLFRRRVTQVEPKALSSPPCRWLAPGSLSWKMKSIWVSWSSSSATRWRRTVLMEGNQVARSPCWRASPPSWGRESCILSPLMCSQLFIVAKEMHTIWRENTRAVALQCSELAAATSPWNKVWHQSCKPPLCGMKPPYPERASLSALSLSRELAGKEVCLASDSRRVCL